MKNLDKLTQYIPKIDEKNQYYFLGGILLVIFLLDYFIMMQPQLATLRTINPKISLLITDIKSAQENMEKLESYQNDAKQLTQKVSVASEQILTNDEVPVILERISRLANAENIKIEQLVPLKGSREMVLEKNDKRYYALPILIEVKGGYHQLGRFINKVETDEIYMNFSNFTLASGGGESTPVNAKLTVKTLLSEQIKK